jgi:7-carboxy-7-deazaguanine synthase
MTHLIPVSEIYGPVMQGEGALAGAVTSFLRTGGCDARCVWCDSTFAVDPVQWSHEWRRLTPNEIVDELTQVTPPEAWVTISGGNPALWDLRPIIEHPVAHGKGWRFAVETQGSRWADWFPLLSHITVSPKPPSAATAHGFSEDVVVRLVRDLHATLKFAVADLADLTWARTFTGLVQNQAGAGVGSVYLQPVNDPRDPGAYDLARQVAAYRMLMEAVLAIPWTEARVIPQLHALAYAAERRR